MSIKDPDYYSQGVLYDRLRARLIEDFGIDFSDQSNALGQAMLDFMVFVIMNVSQMMYNTVEQLFPTRVTKREFLNYLLDKEGQFVVEQVPTKLLVSLTSSVFRVYPKYSLKLQSGEVIFWNDKEVTLLAGEEVEVSFLEGRVVTSGVIFVPGNYDPMWENSVSYVEDVDKSVYIRVPSNLSVNTLEVKSLTDVMIIKDWELKKAFLDSRFNQRVFRLERDPEFDMIRVLSGDGVYGMSFKGQPGSLERAVLLTYMTNSGDVVFDRTKVEIKKAQINGVDYKQELVLGKIVVEERGKIPSDTERKKELLSLIRRSRGVDGEFRLVTLNDYELYLDSTGLVNYRLSVERGVFPELSMVNRMIVDLKPKTEELVFPEERLRFYFNKYGVLTLNYEFRRCLFDIVIPQVYVATGIFTEANKQKIKDVLLDYLSIENLGFDEELSEYLIISEGLKGLYLGTNVQVRWKIVHNWGEAGTIEPLKSLNCVSGVVINLKHVPEVGSVELSYLSDEGVRRVLPIVSGSIVSVNYSLAQVNIQPSLVRLDAVKITYVAEGESLVYDDLWVPYISSEFGIEVGDLNELL